MGTYIPLNNTKRRLPNKTRLVTLLIVVGLITAITFGSLVFSGKIKINKGMGNNLLNKNTTANFASSKKLEEIELNSGDRYELKVSYIEKTVNGNKVKMMAYNGSVLGPFIKVKQGSTIIVDLINNIDVDTTLHSHGVRLENKFDGVPDLTQKIIKPGEKFSYTIKFDDEGLYWYHPHFREDWTQEMGLYGNFYVTPTENYYPKVNKEVPLTLDDLLFEKNKVASFNKNKVDRALMGRYGNIMFINGEDRYNIEVNKNEIVRYLITNTANTRVFNFSIPNAKIKLIGGDSGRYEKETFVDSIVIAPSERYIADVLFPNEGDYKIINDTPEKDYELGIVRVKNEVPTEDYSSQFSDLKVNEHITKSLEGYKAFVNKKSDKNLSLRLNMTGNMMNGGMMESMMGGGISTESSELIEWEDTNPDMNNMSTTSMLEWQLIDSNTGKKNKEIDWKFKAGDKVKISIKNEIDSEHPMQHPIHFHGQRFVVLSSDGKANDNLVWKDTVLVKKGETVDILLDASNPGKWLAHCHIPEHMESGMTLQYEVS